MARYKWTAITLKDLRKAATPKGEPTRAGEPMTGEEAAGRLHISQSHLSNIENGHDRAGPKLLASMRTLYDVPLTVIYEAHANSQASKPAKKRSPR